MVKDRRAIIGRLRLRGVLTSVKPNSVWALKTTSEAPFSALAQAKKGRLCNAMIVPRNQCFNSAYIILRIRIRGGGGNKSSIKIIFCV